MGQKYKVLLGVCMVNVNAELCEEVATHGFMSRCFMTRS